MQAGKLKILYKIHEFNGGAPRSLLAFARVLQSLGHDVMAIGERGPIQSAWEEAGIPVIESPMARRRRPFDSWKELTKLKKTIYRFDPDLIHAATIDEGFFIRFLMPQTPILQTIAGGKGPTNRSLIWRDLPVVGFSDECLEALKRNIPQFRGNIFFIKERLDVKEILEKSKKELPRQLPLGPIILHTSRLEGNKLVGVKQTIEAYFRLLEKGTNASMVVLGGGPDEQLVHDFVNREKEKYPNATVIFLGMVENPYPFYLAADIVTGVGRCVWEGMALAKPAIVVGELGSAGIVNETTAPEMIEYNFSGRNLKAKVPPGKLEKEISKLIEDEQYYRKCSDFSKDFIFREYDAWSNATKIEAMYRRCISNSQIPPYQRKIFFEGLKIFCHAALKKLLNCPGVAGDSIS
ncbi:MAG: hypothetical protein PWR02_113 [Synergistales bacterium]|nr:hypothetical protein [Synergistales bacterium]